MPPTARLRLFTYPDAWPDPDAEPAGLLLDFFNFFRDPPDPRFLDSKHNKEVLEVNTIQSTANPCLATSWSCSTNKSNGLHACVYIADDFCVHKEWRQSIAAVGDDEDVGHAGVFSIRRKKNQIAW
jgi:hypothetical protein